MTDLVKTARQRVDTERCTHYEGCERDHRECLIQRMADEIERQAAALQEARLEVLHGIRAAIPANMASDRPYRPVNLGWSQCAETMRQIIDAAIDAAMKEKWDE